MPQTDPDAPMVCPFSLLASALWRGHNTIKNPADGAENFASINQHTPM